MQKFILILLSFVLLYFAVPSFAADTNQVATNQVSSTTSTNLAARPSDAELQAAAKSVLNKIIVFGIVALIGAVVVAGFALYGAYRKFDVMGAVVVGVILAFGAFVILGFLLIL